MKHLGLSAAIVLALRGLAGSGGAAQERATGAPIGWGADVLRQTPEWYASAPARALADSVLQYQSVDGGWPKNTDLGTPPPATESPAGAAADLRPSER